MPRLSAFGSPALLLTLGLLSYLPLSLPAQELGDRESRIVEAVADNQDRAVALLQETVEINSGTLNAPGQRAVYDAMAPRFEALGFEVEYVQPDVPQRGGHLVARRRGGQG